MQLLVRHATGAMHISCISPYVVTLIMPQKVTFQHDMTDESVNHQDEHEERWHVILVPGAKVTSMELPHYS